MNKDAFFTNLNQHVALTNAQKNQIEQYKNFLQEQNQVLNLTRLDCEEQIYGEYFYDSFLPYQSVNFDSVDAVLDVGSGSGIPGILLKILYPHLQLTIVDSVHKKVVFMQKLVQLLDLKNVQVLNVRAEELSKNYRDFFDLVTARAVADLDVLLELTIPYLKNTGLAVFPKGKNVSLELQQAKNIMRKLKIKLVDNFDYINSLGYKQFALFFQKNDSTPSIYPRAWKSIMHEHSVFKHLVKTIPHKK